MSDDEAHGPGQGPPALPLAEDELLAILASELHGSLATIKRNGMPHLANVVYAFDPAERVIYISTTADRVKIKHLTRDPRCAFHVSRPDRWSYVVADGVAELTPATTVAGDEVGQQLLRWDRVKGIPVAEKDEPAYFAQMVADKRLLICIRASHVYGTAIDVGR